MTTSISDKDALDIAWKYFQQHAQQRYTYLNYFVLFSAALTTGIVATFQPNFEAHYIGIGLGSMQMFISLVFWKIDSRNKFLTKHAENAIKEFESKYVFANEYSNAIKIFSTEPGLSEEHNKSKRFLFKEISHGMSFRIIFVVFFSIGVLGTIISSVAHLKRENKSSTSNRNVCVKNRMDSLQTAVRLLQFNLNQLKELEKANHQYSLQDRK